MVHTLNTILLTSAELFQLRNQLKDLKTLVLHAYGHQPQG
jgi:vacuole morphology and inheritance protein 14